MNWEKWVLVALQALTVLMTISSIGKPRKATTPQSATLTLVIAAGITALVVFA